MSRMRLSAQAERDLRAFARYRCGYCLSPQQLVYSPLEIEHIHPRSRGGSDELENLWLCCPICNGHKSDKTTEVDPLTGLTESLFNPRIQIWSEHFCWSIDGLRIVGKTALGRATVMALHLDRDPVAIEVRSFWVAAGWHPPKD